MHVLTSRLTKTRKNGLLLCFKNDSFIQNGSILFFRADEQGNTPIFVGFLRLSVGLSLGLDRLVLEMKRLKAKKYEMPRPRVFLAQLGNLAKKKSLKTYLLCF